MDYYYAEGDVQKGPFPIGQLADKGIRPDTLVWREGMGQWQRADAVPELAGVLAAGAAAYEPAANSVIPIAPDHVPGGYSQPSAYAAQGYQAPQQAYAQPGYGQSYAAPYAPAAAQPLGYGGSYAAAAPPAGMAIAALILGIISIPTTCFYGVGTVCGILAIIFGHIARGKVRRGEGGGDGMALAGLICGYISLVVLVVVILFVFLAIGSAAVAGGSSGRSSGW